MISGCINGAVTKTITKTELKKIPVMLPPIELQNQFADFVNPVDKSKLYKISTLQFPCIPG
ncbi:MAG: restriction endonuclease subunit S [Blautia wexlerae]